MVLDGPQAAAGSARSSCSSSSASATARTTGRTGCSGGEQQRVAIAVALANDPHVVLADEPTGELDSPTSSDVFGLLRGLNEELGTTIVIVTHDAFVSEQVQRTVAIRDGRTSTETLRRTEQTDERRPPRDRRGVRGGRPGRAGSSCRGRTSRRSSCSNRVRLRLEEDHVGVWPDKPGRATGRRDRGAARSGRRRRPTRRARDDRALRRSRGADRRGPDGRGARRSSATTRRAATVVHALRGIDLEVARGELLAVRGRSGSGKTTLLNLLGGLDKPTSGPSSSTGREISNLDEQAAAGVRRQTIAFVFQTFGLIPILSAAENVEVPLRMVAANPRSATASRRAARARRARAAGEAPAARAVGRRAAAGGDRPGAGQPAAAAARGRAHGPARLRDGPEDHAAASGRSSVRRA